MNSRDSLREQVAVVTGGGRGIGAAIAHRLAGMGAAVVVCGRTPARLQATAKEIRAGGGRCEAIVCDVTQLDSVETMARQVEKLFERLDILVNNAGIGGWDGPLHRMPPAEWEKVLNTNLRGVYYLLHACVPLMQRRLSGHIINISSLAGKNALPNGAAYAASKWALNGLSYSVAEELRSANIRVSVICPGTTLTELSPHTGKDAGKMLRPEDVAHVVAMIVTQAPQAFASEVLLRPTQKP